MTLLKLSAFALVFFSLLYTALNKARQRESKELAAMKKCHRDTLNELKSNLADATRNKLDKDMNSMVSVKEICLLKKIIKKLERWESF